MKCISKILVHFLVLYSSKTMAQEVYNLSTKTIEYMNDRLELIKNNCELLKNMKPNEKIIKQEMGVNQNNPIVSQLITHLSNVLKKRCEWTDLNKKEKALFRLFNPLSFSDLSMPKKVIKIDLGNPLGPQLWKLYISKSWDSLFEETNKLSELKTKEPKKCQFIKLMNVYAQARIARSLQDRNAFYENQLRFMKLLNDSQCQATFFKAKRNEWDDFLSDNILWMARLHWQRQENKRAEELAQKAYAKTLKEKSWDYLLESQQVLFGQIGYEQWSSAKLAKMLEDGLKHWKHTSATAVKAKEWLRSRAGLARFNNKQWALAREHFTKLDNAMGTFWKLKIELETNSKKSHLIKYIDEISNFEPMGFHEWEARKLLDKPREKTDKKLKSETREILENLINQSEKNKDKLIFLSLAFDEKYKKYKSFWRGVFSPTIISQSGRFLFVSSLFWNEEGDSNQSVNALANSAFRPSQPNFLFWTQLYYPKPYSNEVWDAQKLCQVPPHLLYAIMRQESVFDPMAMSPGVGALGLVQVMIQTGRKILNKPALSPYDLFTPSVNIQAGACYLEVLRKKFDNNLDLVAAAYNAGEERVEQWLKTRNHKDKHFFQEMIPFSETRNYVQKVSRNFEVYEWLYSL